MTVVTIPTDQVPEGMKSVHVGVTSFVATALDELSALNSKRVFVVANNSSRKFLEGSDDGDSEGGSKLFINVLRDKGLLAAPLCTSIGMGGGEEGLLAAADAAYEADADVVVTVGGGAVQDAGKLIRLWLSTRQKGSGGEKATVEGIQAAAKCDPMPPLPPQIAIPVCFNMCSKKLIEQRFTCIK